MSIANLLRLTVVMVALLTGCSSKETTSQVASPSAASSPIISDDIKAPHGMEQILGSARYVTKVAETIPLEGQLLKFKGSLQDPGVRNAIEESSPIRENGVWRQLIASIQDWTATNGYAIRTPVGSFLLYAAYFKGAAKTYLVALNVETREAAVSSFDFSGTNISGDGVVAAALWAARALGATLSARDEDKVTFLDAVNRQRATGYLYALSDIEADTEKRREQDSVSANGTAPIAGSNDTLDTTSPTPLLAPVGDSLRYPRGAGVDDVKAVIPNMTCLDMKDQEVACFPPSSFDISLLIEHLPGGCVGADQASIHFNRGKLRAIDCDITKATAIALRDAQSTAYGDPLVDAVNWDPLTIDYWQWKKGPDYVVLDHSHGFNVKGEPVDKFHVFIQSAPSLPLPHAG